MIEITPTVLFFQPIFPHHFSAIIVTQINILNTPLNSLKTIEFMKMLEISFSPDFLIFV